MTVSFTKASFRSAPGRSDMRRFYRTCPRAVGFNNIYNTAYGLQQRHAAAYGPLQRYAAAWWHLSYELRERRGLLLVCGVRLLRLPGLLRGGRRCDHPMASLYATRVSPPGASARQGHVVGHGMLWRCAVYVGDDVSPDITIAGGCHKILVQVRLLPYIFIDAFLLDFS